MPQKLRPRSYEREYVIYFLKDGGEILHEARTTAESRAEAKQWALKYSADAFLQYDKLSIRRKDYDHSLSVAKYMARDGVDPLDSKRTVIQVTVTLRQKEKMQKLYALTGISVKHFTSLVREEIERLYDMYFDSNGDPKK